MLKTNLTGMDSIIQLEERVEELEQREEAWRRAGALVEDLREQLTARMEHERRLQEELRNLSMQARSNIQYPSACSLLLEEVSM
jgi:hypothetical protein